MECPSCTADIPNGSRFCDECGAPVPIGCPSCGALNRTGAKYCSSCGNKLTAAQPIAPSAALKISTLPLSSAVLTAERRQLTVMFCDLVDSTALSARMDPEDLRAVIGTYHTATATAVEQLGGFVAKYLGDGIVVYFGWPHAGETDAERAVRAALAALEALAQVARGGEPLAARIGIATGLAVVGDLLGVGAAQEQAVVGETPNLAARLQALAEPGGVVVDAETHRRVGGLFNCRELGAVFLKGLPGPVSAWQVLGEAVVQSRFEAMHPVSLTPLVGRDDELDLLLLRWRQARNGEGHVVLLSGEPGIGKSRLIAALEERLSGEAPVKFSYFCSPHHCGSALQPIIARWENEAGFVRGEAAGTRLDKLDTLLLPVGATREEVALIAEMLGVPGGERYPPLDLSPQRKKEQTFEALNRVFSIRARQSPILMLFEDAHWADPSSLELLDRVIQQLSSLQVLLVISSRPEFQPPWVGYAGVSLIALSRLSPRQAATLASQVVSGQALPPKMLERIVAQTDGVPLFIEELTKTVVEGTGQADAALSTLPVPSTLQASLMARLDRMPTAKQVAQIGAVIGREFSYELLTAIAGLPKATLAQGLDDLVGAGLAFRRGKPPEATYLFKHALVQDAVYSTLLRGPRQEFHNRIAKALENKFFEQADVEPEVVAHHFTEAGKTQEAVSWWRRAGERAITQSASIEAIAHLSTGLSLIADLPYTPHRAEEEFALLMMIVGPLLVTRGYAAAEVEQMCIRAKQLAEQLGRSNELFPVLRGLWHCYFTRAELGRAYESAERLVALAEEQEDPLRHAIAHRSLGSTLFCLGRFDEASIQLLQGIAVDEPAAISGDRHTRILLYPDRPGIGCRLYLAWSQWHLGYPDRASATIKEAIALSQGLSHATPLAFALSYGAVLYLWAREFEEARQHAEAAIAVAREHSLAQWLAFATMCQGIALVRLGQHEDGMVGLQAGFSGWQRIGARLLDPMWLSFMAEAHAGSGQIEVALAALDHAAEKVSANGELFYQAELQRLRATLLMKIDDLAGAEAWLHRALEFAKSQGAKSLELRAATSLARLWRDQNKCIEARDLLAPIYGWFTAGFDKPDVKDAKSLIDELRE